MSDIELLENTWKKYQFKKRRPWYFLTFLLVVLIIFISMGKNHLTIASYVDKIKNIGIFSSNTKEEDIIFSFNEPFIEIETNIQKLKKQEENDVLVALPILDENPVSKINAHRDDIKSNKNKVFLDIVQTSSVVAYKDVEKRFYQSHKIEDALFLAKSYYRKKNYTKAAFWALETNKLDNDRAQSVFIFVKSKIKLGHKNKGISILKAYIQQSNSIEAKNLLYKIENETSDL